MLEPVLKTHCPKCGRKTDPILDYWKDGGKPRAACKACGKKRNRQKYEKTRKHQIAKAVERKRLDPATASRDMRNYRQRLRAEVLAAYAINSVIACRCCGEDEEKFLVMDHVNNDGSAHRKTAEHGTGNGFYVWLKKNGWPPGFQILCHNCNFAKSAHGLCPHQAT
jgi:transposase-like protein